MFNAEKMIEWVETNLTFSLGGEKIKLLDHQKEVFRRLETHKIVAMVVPKRSGKTTTAACVALSFALNNDGVTVGILSTSEQHASTVCLSTIKRLYVYSFTKDKVDEKTKLRYSSHTHMQFGNRSVIRSYPCVASAIAGQRFDFLVIDEICYIKDPEPVFVALGQLDSPQSRALITTTVSKKSHFFYSIYEAWLEGKETNFDFLYLRGKSPLELNPHLDKQLVEIMESRYPPALRRMLFENEWGEEGEDVVFTNIPIVDIADFNQYLSEVKPLRVEISIGLDRALPYSIHGDKTAAVVMAKLYKESGDEYIVLEEREFVRGDVFNQFLAYVSDVEQRYGRVNFVRADVYQSFDLLEELSAAGYNTELFHVTTRFKHENFHTLVSLTNRGILKVNSTCTNLLKEMRELLYNDGKFSAPAGGHDDFVYAMLYAFVPLYKSKIPQVWFIDETGEIIRLL